MSDPASAGEAAGTISNSSRQKAAASKAFLEQHYKGLLRDMTGGSGARPVNRPRERATTVADFEMLRLIGRGAFGEVFICKRVEDRSPQPELLAMKRLRKADMLAKKQVSHVRSEQTVMAEAAQQGAEEGRQTPWVVQLYHSFQDDQFLYMVMSYLPGGDLMSWLCEKEIFSVEATRFYMAELVLAVHSVHAMKYVHRDIKPDNVLLDAQGHVQLSDFGLCKAFSTPDGHVVDLYTTLGVSGAQETTGAAPPPVSPVSPALNVTMEPTGGVSAFGAARGVSPQRIPPPPPPPPPPGSPERDDGCPNASAAGGSPSRSSIPVSPGGVAPTSPAPPAAAAAPATSGMSADDRRLQFSSFVGSPGYIAPEILLRQPYSIACDWWSVGIIMYECLYGCPPFYSEDPRRTCHKITQWREFLRFPTGRGVPNSAVDLLRRLLCDQADRIPYEELLAHPFFEGVDWATVARRPGTGAFAPTLSHPLDTRYFPPLAPAPDVPCEGTRPGSGARASPSPVPMPVRAGQDPAVAAEDPRGILFADFKFNIRHRR